MFVRPGALLLLRASLSFFLASSFAHAGSLSSLPVSSLELIRVLSGCTFPRPLAQAARPPKRACRRRPKPPECGAPPCPSPSAAASRKAAASTLAAAAGLTTGGACAQYPLFVN
jgi:hypothetical protein